MYDFKLFDDELLCLVARVVLEMRIARSSSTRSYKELATEAAQSLGFIAEDDQSVADPNGYWRLGQKHYTKYNQNQRAVVRRIIELSTAKYGIGDYWTHIVAHAESRQQPKPFDTKYNLPRGDTPQFIKNPTIRPEDVTEDDVRLVSRPLVGADGQSLTKETMVPIAMQLLGITPGDAGQDNVAELEGHYLLVRYLFSADRYVVSYMVIYPPSQPRTPAFFLTWGGEEQKRYGFDRVSGVAFALDNLGEFMTIGMANKKLNVRAAIMRIVDNSELPGVGKDLQGVRVSTGSNLNHPNGHRFWCKRLDTGIKKQEAKMLVGTFKRETMDARVKRHLGSGYDQIIEWLREVPTVSIEKYRFADRNLKF